MKFTNLLKNLIVEASRFEVLYNTNVKPKQKKGQEGQPGEKSKGNMTFEVLKQIIFADPDTKAPEGFDKENATPEQMEKDVKVGKYTNWLVKNFLTPKESDFEFEGERDPKNSDYKRARAEFDRLYLEDLFKQTERLQFYEKVKQYLPQEQRDINKLGIKDLFQIFSTFELPEKKKKEEEKKLAKKTREGFKHAGGEILYEGNKWILIKISDKGPTGKDAAIYYGGYKDHRNGESEWCTSGPGLSFFDGYIKDGPLYVIFPQDDKGQVGKRTGLPMERYQFHFPSDQFMDRDDHRVDLVKLLNGEMSELKPYFKKEFVHGLSSVNGTKLDFKIGRGAAGMYIGIYGYEELFNNLPETIEHIRIENDKHDFSEPIPESIGRLKNLDVLMLINCVSSVPDSIGNCKNLSFLSLPDNKNLKSLPESISNLNLNFLNVRNCAPELIERGIPAKLKEKLMDAGKENSADKGFFFVLG